MSALADPALVRAVLDDHRTAPIPPRLRAALDLLETLTLAPGALTPADVEACRAAGLDDRAIEEVLVVGFAFDLIDRLADAFDFRMPTAKSLRRLPRFLLSLPYTSASLPG